jgi:hypothetical protein
VEGKMRSSSIAALGAALALSACGRSGPGPIASASEEPAADLSYACQAGGAVRVEYLGSDQALVTYRHHTWHMAAVAGQPGRFALQNRQWQVGLRPDGEEGVLTALGTKPAAIARCHRAGPLSTAAASLPPPGSAPACTVADLSLKFTGEDAGAGQRWDTFAVANRGRTPCAIQGFPEVRMLGEDGTPAKGVSIEPSLQQGPGAGPAERIEIAPAGRAVFYLHWTPIQSGSETCPHVTRLDVTVPGGRSGLIPLNATPCGGRAEVTPLRKDQGAGAQ